jgi:acetoacetyl-CoA synthetase
LDRFSQIEPKVIFTVNAIVYNGKTHDHLKKVAEVTKNLPTLEKIIVIPFVPTYTMDLTSLNNSNALPYTDLFNSSEAVPELTYEQVSFDHPVYILFSSGTTGVPKCLVHSVGGMIIQHKKEHQLHGNLGPKDILLQYTTAGWMMWNWLVGGLLVGSSIVTYDGSPFRPDPFVLFRLMEEVGVTAFGTSAKYIQSLQDQPLIPREHHKLPTLHSIYSTGSPLKPEDYEYTYKSIHPNVCLGSITGGTDICSLFGAHNFNLPVYRGEIQCIGLGMKVESWTHTNTPVFDIPGDLVCTAAFPCMPVYLWNDPDNVKYRAAYFDTFPGVWCQGDYVQIGGQTGGLLMLGRSDGTLNPSGVRFGSAEIYNTLDIFPEIEDSVVIGQKIKDDERVILFIKTKEGYEFGQDLITRVKTHIRQVLSPRHVPCIILPTTDIPYTVNGKKVEVAVKKIVNGYPLDKVEKGTLINPESLALYHNLPELKLE